MSQYKCPRKLPRRPAFGLGVAAGGSKRAAGRHRVEAGAKAFAGSRLGLGLPGAGWAEVGCGGGSHALDRMPAASSGDGEASRRC